MTMVADVGGADVIVPLRNITARTGGCGITDGIVPRRNIAATPQYKYVPTVHGAEIKGGARRPAEPQIKEPT